MTVITIPHILRDKLTDAGAEALITLLNATEDRSHDRTIEVVEERFERRLTEEISKLDVRMAQMETRLIRWMFTFWAGQLVVLTGLFFTFLRRG